MTFANHPPVPYLVTVIRLADMKHGLFGGNSILML
jgi:hypothetical protein